MALTDKISNTNFYSFIWHASFLAFAQSFMDVDTIIPAMIIESGGGAMHIGIMTAIMLGGSSFTQLFFAPLLSNKPFKKKHLLFGINLRVISLISLAIILFYFMTQSSNILWIIFFFITIFSLSGAYANISYVDILGKSVNQDKRKSFFSTKQIIAGVIVLSSAFLAKKTLSSYDFPSNYASMFLIGGIALLIASGGFWNIKEAEPSVLKISGFRNFLRTMRVEIKKNKRLIYFLGFINTQGIIISFIPFVVLYAKQMFNTQSSDTGSFLLFKIIGVVTVSMLVLLAHKKIRYNILLYINVFLSLLLVFLPVQITDASMLKYIFVLGGITFSLYSITMNGLLLEISGNENRALYTGFAGAGNILPAIFPLIAGGIISQFGFQTFFVLFMIIVSFSFYFIFRINCKK